MLHAVSGSYLHALWACESMYLISQTHGYETKILDVAYLIMVKLMKRETKTCQIVELFTRILVKADKHQEAIDFIKQNLEYFSFEESNH